MTLSLLEGVTVLDLGRLMPSAIATFELGKLGADVIKVEFPPSGDYLRINPPHVRGRGDMHLDINRNKRSVCLDPAAEAGGEALRGLIRSADVVVVAARPPSLRRLGLDDASCRSINPALVHCTITGYGTSGPYAGLGAHGLSSDAAAGIVPLVAGADGRPVVAPEYTSVGPRAAGLHASLAIVAALFRRHRSDGQGRSIDVSQWDCAMAWNYRNVDQFVNTNESIPAYRELGFRYAIYTTGDDRHVLFAAPEPRLWQRFCRSVGRPDLAALAGDAAIEFDDNVAGALELEGIFRSRSQADWIELAVREGIPIAPVMSLADLVDDPHVAHREMVVEADHPLGGSVRLTGHPAKYGDDRVSWSPAPELGRHTSEVLIELGFSESQISRVMAETR